MPSSDNLNIKNKVSIKVDRKGAFVAIGLGGASILLEPEEAIDIAEKITKHSDKILRDFNAGKIK